MKANFIAGCVIFMLVSICGAQESANAPISSSSDISTNGLRLTTSILKEHYSPLEPIVVNFTITNTSDEVQIIATGRPELLYVINLFQDENYEVPRTRYGKEAVARARHTQIKPWGIKSQGEYKEELLLNRYFDMSMPGVYRLSFKRRLSMPGSSGALTAQSGTIDIIISEHVPEAGSAWGAR